VRDPFKVLSGAFTSHRHYGELRGGLPILKSVAQCELVLNSGVPILQRYAESALNDLRTVRFAKHFEAESFEYREIVKSKGWQEEKRADISPIARESFYRAFGVSVEEQLRIESELDVKFPTVWQQSPLPRSGRDTDILAWTLDPAFRVWSGSPSSG